MKVWNTRTHSVPAALALGAILATGASAQSTGDNMKPAATKTMVCRVTPVKNSPSDTAYTIRTDSAVADSTRLAVNGTTVRCRAPRANANTTRQSSSGDVALAPRARSTTRIPISKEPAPAPEPEPVVAAPTPAPPAPAPEPAPVVVETPAPAPTPEPAPIPMKRYGNGFYIGLGGGAGVPTEAVRIGYDPGLALQGLIGWDNPTGPFGLRLDLGYTRLDARKAFRTTGVTTAPGFGTANSAIIASGDAQIWSALADLKLRFPFNGNYDGAATGLYLVGGGGVNYFRNYATNFALTNPEFNNATATSTATTLKSLTRTALNAGGGLSWGIGSTEVFIESRYVTTFTDGRRASFVPITLGLAFK